MGEGIAGLSPEEMGKEQTEGYLAPRTYIKQEVTLPEPALDLALLSSYEWCRISTACPNLLHIELLHKGAHGMGFDPLILSGPRAALPHATAADRILQPGDCLIIDFGGKIGSCTTDITRAVAIGTNNPEWKEIYEVVNLWLLLTRFHCFDWLFECSHSVEVVENSFQNALCDLILVG